MTTDDLLDEFQADLDVIAAPIVSWAAATMETVTNPTSRLLAALPAGPGRGPLGPTPTCSK
jgi:hypothetical protein